MQNGKSQLSDLLQVLEVHVPAVLPDPFAHLQAANRAENPAHAGNLAVRLIDVQGAPGEILMLFRPETNQSLQLL